MIRGDIVVVALQGDHGKPRPALVVQADPMADTAHIVVIPLTSFGANSPLFRVPVLATPATGLAVHSYAMLERMGSVARDKIAKIIGRVDDATMLAVNRALVVFLGLA